MSWLDPIIVHGAHRLDAAALEAQAQHYRERLQQYIASHG
jgi:putative NADPH-quinone reductase